MKQGTLITKIIMFIIFAGVVLYLAIYAVRSFSDPFSSVMAYQDSLNDSVEVTGVVVREEKVLPNGAAIMDILPNEGERVATGDAVAILYENSTALERKKELQKLEQERAHLEYALKHGSNLRDAAKLEKQIIESILALRTMSVGKNFSSLDSDALSLRTQVLQREFTYSASGDSAAALSDTIASLDARISQLKSLSSSDTTSVSAPHSGLFSAVSDGLESVLNPDFLSSVSAQQLSAYIGKETSPQGTPVGKLITSDRWCFAAVVPSETAARLREGDWITVSFSKDLSLQLEMRVDRIDKANDNGCVLVLSSDRHLKDTTMLRTQTVELIFESYIGIRVPKQALRMITMTLPDGETQKQMVGVYTVVGARAEFNLVDIIREGSDYYLLAPSEEARTCTIVRKDGNYSLVTALDQSDLHILRAGDEVIVSASGLYDGKVVLE